MFDRLSIDIWEMFDRFSIGSGIGAGGVWVEVELELELELKVGLR